MNATGSFEFKWLGRQHIETHKRVSIGGLAPDDTSKEWSSPSLWIENFRLSVLNADLALVDDDVLFVIFEKAVDQLDDQSISSRASKASRKSSGILHLARTLLQISSKALL